MLGWLTNRRRITRLTGALAVLGLVLAGCGEDDPNSGSRDAEGDENPGTSESAGSGAADDTEECRLVGASSAAPGGTVQLTLTEYAVAAVPTEASAGTVELAATNGGTIPHELALYRFEGDPATLPTSFVGGVDESQLPDDAVVGRIRWLEVGQTCSLPLDLRPGRYLLICNLVDDGSNPHYAHGMYAALTVT